MSQHTHTQTHTHTQIHRAGFKKRKEMAIFWFSLMNCESLYKMIRKLRNLFAFLLLILKICLKRRYLSEKGGENEKKVFWRIHWKSDWQSAKSGSHAVSKKFGKLLCQSDSKLPQK